MATIAMAREWVCAYILNLLGCRAANCVRALADAAVNEVQKGKRMAAAGRAAGVDWNHVVW
jgi:hypothetical protein